MLSKEGLFDVVVVVVDADVFPCVPPAPAAEPDPAVPEEPARMTNGAGDGLMGNSFMLRARHKSPANVVGGSTMVQNRKKHIKNSHRIIRCPTSLGVSERASEQVSAAERASKASSAEQANK